MQVKRDLKLLDKITKNTLDVSTMIISTIRGLEYNAKLRQLKLS
jgi:hypothetical protein